MPAPGWCPRATAPSPATVVVSIAIGVLADPLRRLLQKRIDRALFRPKYAAERQIDAFEEKLRQKLDPKMRPEQLERTLERELGRTWASLEPRLAEFHETRAGRQESDDALPSPFDAPGAEEGLHYVSAHDLSFRRAGPRLQSRGERLPFSPCCGRRRTCKAL